MPEQRLGIGLAAAEIAKHVHGMSPAALSQDGVAEAAAELIVPLVAAVAVVIIVFLPLFALQGVEGKTFKPLAAAAALAMFGSLIYAVLFAPALATTDMRPGKTSNATETGIFGRLLLPITAVFVRHRPASVVLALLMLALGALVVPRLGSEFTPALEEGDILLRTTMAPSISLTEARAIAPHK